MWSAEDWLLEGEYCPEADIIAVLEVIRQQHNADSLIHLATDKSALLRRLSFAVPEKSDRLAAIREHRERGGTSNVLARAVRRVVYGSTDKSINPEQMLIEALRVEGGLTSSQASLAWVGSRGADTANIRSVLVLVGGSQQMVEPAVARKLAAMINATPHAESRRDARWMEHSRDWPRFPDFAQSIFADDVSTLAARALDLAVKVTEATSACLYLGRATEPRRLFLAGAVSATGSPDGLPYPNDIDRNRDPDLIEVLQRQRSIQRRTGRLFTNEAESRLEFHNGAEMLCPIPWTSASPYGAAAGAMILHRFPGGQSFSSQDLALARNVCLRFALHRNGSAAAHIASETSRLRRALPSGGGTALPPNTATRTDLPADVEQAVRRVASVLPTLAAVTDSHSISLRLLLPDPGSPVAPGHALVRVAAFPSSELTREPEVQRPDDGANWTAIRTGLVEVIADTSSSTHYTAVRPDSCSELCAPVRSEGRLMGILNLESPYLDHFAALSPLVEAFAASVGRTLVDSAADHARATLARALTTDNLTHDLNKHLVAASLQLKGHAAEAEVAAALETVDRIKLLSDDPPRSTKSLHDVFVLAEREAQVISFRLSRTLDTEIGTVQCAGYQATALVAALRNLFMNIKAHGSTTGSAIVEQRAQRMDFDGTTHLTLRITNRSAFAIDPATAADLYRVPVPRVGSRGKRLGAYLAGVQIRAIGGLMGAALGSDDQTLVTTMSFPIEP